MNNRDQLIALIVDNQLQRRDVAELLKVSQATVDRWLLTPESSLREEVPEMAIELLRLKLQLRSQSAPKVST